MSLVIKAAMLVFAWADYKSLTSSELVLSGHTLCLPDTQLEEEDFFNCTGFISDEDISDED